MIIDYLKIKRNNVLSVFKRLKFMIKDHTVKIASLTDIKSDTLFEGFNSIGTNCSISGLVGKYSYIGNNINTISARHPVSDFISSHPVFYSTLTGIDKTFVKENRFEEYNYVDKKNKIAIEIGNDVWIGNNVLILGGIKIGNGAIIAAGSVVTKNIEPYSVVGGIPAKLIKKRFDTDLIKKLQDIKWWDNDEEWLTENAIHFNNINKIKEW